MNLKPCPFCGEEAKVLDIAPPNHYWTIKCTNTKCRASTGIHSDIIKAMKTWNTRVERTCSLIKQPIGRTGDKYRLVCSECSHVAWELVLGSKPKYCPNCGARVVDDDK